MNEPVLDARDRELVEILRTTYPAAESSVSDALALQARARDLGVRLGLGEVLTGAGSLPANVFVAACQAAAKKGIGLIDRSSMRHLNVGPAEDADVVQVAINYGLLSEADLSAATALRDELARMGLGVLFSKILADRAILDVEVYEGVLHVLRDFQAKSGGAAPARSGPRPFDEEDLALGFVCLSTGRLTRVQVERALKIRTRLRKAGIERNLVEILHEQGVLERDESIAIAGSAAGRLDPPRSIPLELARFAPEEIAVLEREAAAGRLAPAEHLVRAREIRDRLAQVAIDRPLARILIDLGLDDRAATEAVLATLRLPAAPPPVPPPRVAVASPLPPPAFAPPGPVPPPLDLAEPDPPSPPPAPGAPPAPRRTGRVRRRYRPRSGSPVLAIGVLGAAFAGLIGMALFLKSRSSEPAAPPEPGPVATATPPPDPIEPPPAGPVVASAEAIARIDAAIRAWRFAEAVAACAEWKDDRRIVSRSVRAAALDRFLQALVEAIGRAGAVELGGEDAWTVTAADAEGLVAIRGPGGEPRRIGWPEFPATAVDALAVRLDVLAVEPMGTLHHLAMAGLDRRLLASGASAIAASPALRKPVLDLVALHLGLRSTGDLVVLEDRIARRDELPPTEGPPPAVEPDRESPPDPGEPGEADRVAAAGAKAREAEGLARAGRYDDARALLETVVEEIGPSAEGPLAGVRSRCEERIDDLRRIGRLFASVREQTAGRTLARWEYVARDRSTRKIESMDEKEVRYAHHGGRAITALAWDRHDPSDLHRLFECMQLGPEDRFDLAVFCFEHGLEAEVHGLLVGLLKSDPGLQDRIFALFARKSGVDVPPGGFVVHGGRLMSPGERDWQEDVRRIEGLLTKVAGARPEALPAALEAVGQAFDEGRSRHGTRFAEQVRPRIVESLGRVRQEAIASLRQQRAKDGARLTRLRDELEKRRGHALDLILDEIRYPYDDCHGCKAQPEVDVRVAAVTEIWERPLATARSLFPDVALGFARVEAIDAFLSRFGPDAVPPEARAEFEELVNATNARLGLKSSDATMEANAKMQSIATDAEREQVRITNEYRQMMGRQTLRLDDRLVEAARRHSEYMRTSKVFAHEIPGHPDGATPSERANRAGYGGGVGENIAACGPDPRVAHDGWYRSSGHHRNILHVRYRAMGAGNAGSYWTQVFGQ